MRPLFDQAVELQRFFVERQWRFCVIGGLAVIRWGEPRFTRDVDLALFTGFGSEANYARELLAVYEPRISDALEFAVANRVLLIQGAMGVPVDIAFSGFPFEEEMIERATDFEYAPGVTVRTVSAEDLVVLKAFASRPQDWVDVAGIAARHGRTLDWTAIGQRLAPLAELKGEKDIFGQLDRIRVSFSA